MDCSVNTKAFALGMNPGTEAKANKKRENDMNAELNHLLRL